MNGYTGAAKRSEPSLAPPKSVKYQLVLEISEDELTDLMRDEGYNRPVLSVGAAEWGLVRDFGRVVGELKRIEYVDGPATGAQC